MIILHEKNENAYKSNGLGLLDKNIIYPKVLWKLNGEYTFSFKYPLRAALGSEIKNGMQVEVVSDALSDVFRIQVTEQSMGYITAYCEQKSYDLIDNFIEDINIVNCTGIDAIKRIQNAMTYPHPFILSSTITDVKNARMIRLGGMQALMDQRLANSFLSRWGGEIERSYNEVKIVPHIGQDFGVKIQYRKDLVGYKAKIDSSTVVTRIRPVGFNGLSLPEKYVDSVRIDPKHPKIKKIKYEKAKAALGQYKDDKDAVPESEALEMLRRFAAEDFRKGIDQPTATYDVDFVLLKNTEEYRDIANLQTIRGGDTVTVEHALDGFFVSARCVQFEYNPLTGEYVSMRLGNIKESLSETLTTSRDLEALREEQQAIQHSYMDVVSKEIEKTWRNEDGYNYELKKENPFDLPAGYYSFNAPIDQNPTKVIGISAGSLVISNRRQSDGKWNFRTFGTGEGFTADLIRAGMLQGGGVKWNLETGYLNIGDKLIYDPSTGELHLAQGSVTIDALDEGTKRKINQAIELSGAITDTVTEYAMGGCGNAAPMDGWSEDALLTMADKNDGVNLPYDGDVALITMRQEKMRAIKKDGSFSDSSFSLEELLPDRFYVYVDQLPTTLSGFESSIPTYYTGSSSPVETLKRFYIEHYTDGGFQKLFKTGCLWKRTLYKCSDGTVKYSPAERMGKDGKWAYVHIAYADDDKGGGFSFDDSDKAYMGQYTDQEEETSTDATRYKWTRIRGKDGTDGNNGTNGRGVKTVITQYAVVYSDETPSGSSWTDTPPSYWTEYAKVWQRLKVTYTDGGVGYTTPEKFNDEALKSLKEKMNTIESGYTEIKDGQARFVTKSALGAVGETSINGFNITTGAIRSQTGDTYIDLNGSNFTFGRGAMTYSPSDGLRIGGSRYYMTSDNRCFAIHSTEWTNGRLGGFRATTDDQNMTNGVMLYASHGFNFRISTQPDQADNTYKHHIVLYNGAGGSAWTELQQDTIVRTKLFAVNAGMIQATELRSSSDIRLKKDIKPWEVKALDVIDATDFIRFRWKEGDDTQEHYGVSAQSIPMAQVKRKDGYLAVDGYTMSAINGKAIQELSGKVKQLEQQNKGLQMRIKRLEEVIHDIIGRS